MTSKTFINKLFPNEVSYGSSVNMTTSTNIIVTQNGYEKRNANWLDPLNSFSVSIDNLTNNDMFSLRNMILQCKGPLITFKFKNWTDYTCEKFESSCNYNGKLNGSNKIEMFKKYLFTSEIEGYRKRICCIAYDNSLNDEDDIPESIYFNFYKNDVNANDLIERIDYINGIIYLKNTLPTKISTSMTKELNAKIYSSNHTLETGDLIMLEFNNNSWYKQNMSDKVFTVTKIDDNSFTINFDTTNAVSEVGTYQLKKYPQNINNNDNYSFECEFYNKVRFGNDIATIVTNSFNSNTFAADFQEVRYKFEEE